MRADMTGQTLRAIGFLMTYPEEDRIAAAAEIRELLGREAWLSEKMRSRLDEFLAGMNGADLLDLQEEYVALFDRTRPDQGSGGRYVPDHGDCQLRRPLRHTDRTP